MPFVRAKLRALTFQLNGNYYSNSVEPLLTAIKAKPLQGHHQRYQIFIVFRRQCLASFKYIGANALRD